MLSLWHALGVPSARTPLDASVFATFILPLLAYYLVMAVLVIMPRTHTARVALWPVFVLLALRAATSVSISNSKPQLKLLDGYFSCTMFVLSARTLEWALAKEPLMRQLRPANNSPSVIMDALDLTINLRGHGWNWSHGFFFPQDTRPKNRFAFSLYVILSAVGHLLIFGICQRAVLSFCSAGSATTDFSLFDESLSLFMQYIRASIIVALQFGLSYSSSQAAYDIGAVISVLVFGQEPAQWPPIFDAPWRSTSLTEFWGRRWHQWFRHIFLSLGGPLFSTFLGKSGTIIGGFVVSAIMHGFLMIGIGSREAAQNVILAFLMMLPVGLAERLFYRFTGKKVGGVAGAIWTVTWVTLSGTMVVEGWIQTGAMGNESIIDGVWPVRMLVEQLIKQLDVLLHAIDNLYHPFQNYLKSTRYL